MICLMCRLYLQIVSTRKFQRFAKGIIIVCIRPPMEVQPPQRQLVQLPNRVKGSHNKSFKSVNVITNHYKVELQPCDQIIIFRVKITPRIAEDNRTLRSKLLEKALPEIKSIISNPVISGMNIYTKEEPAATQKQIAVEQHVINIKQVKVFNIKQNPKLLLAFLNNGLRNIMNKLNYIEIGRTGKYFNVNDKKLIDNLMMFSGFKSSFVLLENGYFLKVDSAKKIVRNQTVLQAIDEIIKIHGDKDKQERRNVIRNQLVTKVVMTNYGKTRYHKIEDVVFQELDSIILGQNGLTISKYYEEKYQIIIKNNKQPLLKVENKKSESRCLLIPELCLMTGIPDDFDQFRRKKISEATIKEAGEKHKQIGKLMEELKDTQEINSLRQLGIKLNRSMEVVKSRIIPAPKLTLGSGGSVESGKEAFFNLFNKPIFAAKHSIKVGIIFFDNSDIRPLLETFKSTSRNLGVKMDIIEIKAGDFDSRHGVTTLQKYIDKAADKQECNICLIVLPNQLKTQYKKIKIAALIKSQIICQVVTDGTLRKKNLQSIATKVLLQIIAKRGNTLWVPESSHKVKDTMLSAFDQAKISGNKYNVSLCATINSTFSSVYSKTTVYEGNQAKFLAMITLHMSAIHAYAKRNSCPPKDIIIFQNSCTGDQISIINEFFIQPFINKIEEIYKGEAPCLTVIMVNVKTSERFFTEGQIRNVPAGTLISEGLVSQFYDFYMVSQNSTRGAVLPNHYKVIFNNSKMQEGFLQELIFDQCFNYVNWTGSIKVPGILQYAKKCAKFSAEVLEDKQIAEDLQNKLYFV